MNMKSKYYNRVTQHSNYSLIQIQCNSGSHDLEYSDI